MYLKIVYLKNFKLMSSNQIMIIRLFHDYRVEFIINIIIPAFLGKKKLDFNTIKDDSVVALKVINFLRNYDIFNLYFLIVRIIEIFRAKIYNTSITNIIIRKYLNSIIFVHFIKS